MPSRASFLIKRATFRQPSLCDVMFFTSNRKLLHPVFHSDLSFRYICILLVSDKLCNQFRLTKFDTFRHYSNFRSHFVNGAWPSGHLVPDPNVYISKYFYHSSHYSTVTLLARFLGLSTSRPLALLYDIVTFLPLLFSNPISPLILHFSNALSGFSFN